MQGNTHRISLSELSEFRMGVFAKLEFLTEYAEAVTSGLLEAHLRGAHKQGAGRLPIYVKRIKLGFINNKPDAKAVTETSGSAILHGDHGIGHYAVSKGMDLAIDKAEANGVGAVGVRNSAHFGVAARYGRLLRAGRGTDKND